MSAAVMVLYVISPPSFIPEGDRGLYEVPTTANPVIADLEIAVEQADESAPTGTALLVLGQEVSWHDALWSPNWSDRPFFYDDWLWYWQTKHYGDYDPTVEHAYEREDSPIDAEYLQRHGIGAVVVIGDAEPTAEASPLLSLVREGLHDVYFVRDPTSVVTFDGLNAEEFVYGNEHITAVGVGSGGTATIRRNWFPRWSAEVNGERVPITETDDGYMTVPIPEGDVDIELTYVVDRWDWLARLMSLVGFVSVLVLLVPRRWLTREASGRNESGPPQLDLQV
jgi:hypothetical protein